MRTISAGIACALLLGIEAIGLPTFRLLLYPSALNGENLEPESKLEEGSGF